MLYIRLILAIVCIINYGKLTASETPFDWKTTYSSMTLEEKLGQLFFINSKIAPSKNER